VENAFSVKLNLTLKALSMNRSRLATELGVDKSIVGRWARGAVKPSPESLARLTEFVAERAPGFTALDWEREPLDLMRVLGVERDFASVAPPRRLDSEFHDGLIKEASEATARRGSAFEGFFRSTRPHGSEPGVFLHDQMMVRRGADGLMRFDLRCDRVRVTGWVLPQQNQLFVIGAEDASGSAVFGIFNAAAGDRVDVIDGLLLACALDVSRTPTACAMIFERTGELSEDPAADDVRLDELGALDPVATTSTLSEALAEFLVRDFGPTPMSRGGDWLLRLPLTRSVACSAGLRQRLGGFARAFAGPVAAS
jgi:transcriptional regulator with XRE-family HTH domain